MKELLLRTKYNNCIFAILLLLVVSSGICAQTESTPASHISHWYVGIQAGTSLGQCTFRSITEHDTRFGFQGGAAVGYCFNRPLSMEAGATLGTLRATACDCCPYWLSDDGGRYFAPLSGHDGWYYADLKARTTWLRLGLQLNVDLLSLIIKGETRWSVSLSPQISAFYTDTDLQSSGQSLDARWTDDTQWHLGLGGQLSAGYRLTGVTTLSIYGGLTHLTGQRYDLLPKFGHKSNLIYEAGIRLTFAANR